MDAEAVTHPGRDPGFVQGDPEPDTIREGLVDDARVLCKAIARVPVGPAAHILQRLRQVPVVEREHRFDRALPQAVDEPAVEVEASLVGVTAPFGLDAGPGHREAIGMYPELGHQVEVFFQAVILVAGDVPRIVVDDLARGMAERVPDGRAAAAFVHGALDLVGGRRRAPQEVLWKVQAYASLYCRGQLRAPLLTACSERIEASSSRLTQFSKENERIIASISSSSIPRKSSPYSGSIGSASRMLRTSSSISRSAPNGNGL